MMYNKILKGEFTMEWPIHIVAAGGYVFDRKGNILLVKTHNRGWGCTGGQIEEGEDLEQGLLREILEESGITAEIKYLCGVYSNVGKYLFYDGITPVPTKIMFDFICEYKGGECQTSDETSEVIWVAKEEIFNFITSPAQIYRFQKVLAFENQITYASYVTHPEFKLLKERMI